MQNKQISYIKDVWSGNFEFEHNIITCLIHLHV